MEIFGGGLVILRCPRGHRFVYDPDVAQASEDGREAIFFCPGCWQRFFVDAEELRRTLER